MPMPTSILPREISTQSRRVRFVSDSVMKQTGDVKNIIDRNELDSHADTCVAGANSLIISRTGDKVNVKGFNSTSQFKNIDIGTVAYAVDSHDTGETIVCIVNECLLFHSSMKYSLLSTTQLRAHRTRVIDTPRQFDESSSHSIASPILTTDLHENPKFS